VTKGLIAELALVVLLVVAGPFVVHPLILVLLLASQSLWIRGSSWADVGLRRPTAVHHTLLTTPHIARNKWWGKGDSNSHPLLPRQGC
jgi:hypothetical protein